MFFHRSCNVKLKNLLFSSLRPSHLHEEHFSYNYIQLSYYVNVTMKWKKDKFYDSIEIIHKSRELKPLIALKNCIIAEPDGCIPISSVSKRGREFEVTSAKVASFLRKYPSVFEEFTGPNYNLPWFRLTPEAIELDNEEQAVYVNQRLDIVGRIKKLIMMTREKKLPLKIIKGLQWYLGLPDEFLKFPNNYLDESFTIVEMADGLKGLSVDSDERILTVLQKNAMKRGEYNSEGSLAFALFPSKGLRLKRKISNWLDMFQNLPYVSPYEESSHLDPNSDVSEKRVVGVLHELLSLFVDQSAERKKLFCLRTHLGLPQKFYKAFERHPHVFYLSLVNKTCTAILKEAYNSDDSVIKETHPILGVRKKYIKLMNNSNAILKARSHKKQALEFGDFNLDVDFDSGAGDIGEDASMLCK